MSEYRHAGPSSAFDYRRNPKPYQQDAALNLYNVWADGEVNANSLYVSNIFGTSPVVEPTLFSRLNNEKDALLSAPPGSEVFRTADGILTYDTPVGTFITDSSGAHILLDPTDDLESRARQANYFNFVKMNLRGDPQMNWRWSCRFNYKSSGLEEVKYSIQEAINIVKGNDQASRSDRYWINDLYVEEAIVPNPSIDNKRWARANRTAGIPGRVSYAPMTLTLFEDSYGRSRTGVNAWQEAVVDKNGLYGLPNEYKRSMLFILESNLHEPNYVFFVDGLYPLEIQETTFNSGEGDRLRITVTLNVDRVVTRTPDINDIWSRYYENARDYIDHVPLNGL